VCTSSSIVSTRIWVARWSRNSTRANTLTSVNTTATVMETFGTNSGRLLVLVRTVRSTTKL